MATKATGALEFFGRQFTKLEKDGFSAQHDYVVGERVYCIKAKLLPQPPQGLFKIVETRIALMEEPVVVADLTDMRGGASTTWPLESIRRFEPDLDEFEIGKRYVLLSDPDWSGDCAPSHDFVLRDIVKPIPEKDHPTESERLYLATLMRNNSRDGGPLENDTFQWPLRSIRRNMCDSDEKFVKEMAEIAPSIKEATDSNGRTIVLGDRVTMLYDQECHSATEFVIGQTGKISRFYRREDGVRVADIYLDGVSAHWPTRSLKKFVGVVETRTSTDMAREYRIAKIRNEITALDKARRTLKRSHRERDDELWEKLEEAQRESGGDIVPF